MLVLKNISFSVCLIEVLSKTREELYKKIVVFPILIIYFENQYSEVQLFIFSLVNIMRYKPCFFLILKFYGFTSRNEIDRHQKIVINALSIQVNINTQFYIIYKLNKFI